MGSLKLQGLNVGVNAEKFRKVVVFIPLGFPQTQQFSHPKARPERAFLINGSPRSYPLRRL